MVGKRKQKKYSDKKRKAPKDTYVDYRISDAKAVENKVIQRNYKHYEHYIDSNNIVHNKVN